MSALAACAARAPESRAPPPGVVVLLELFTSEGCSTCPPADEALRKLAIEPGVIAFEEHVDYWDNLGWKDPYSQALFSARQRGYAVAFRRQLYTPQLVVDGTAQVMGSDEDQVRDAIAHGQPKREIPLSLEADALTVGEAALAEPADLFLVITEDGLQSAVERGENAGKTLLHAPVARLLRKIEPGRLPLELKPGQRAVVFAQSRKDLRVLAIGAVTRSALK